MGKIITALTTFTLIAYAWIAVAVAVAVASASPAEAQPRRCLPYEQAVEKFEGKLGATLLHRGMMNEQFIVEFWTRPDGLWFIVDIDQNKMTCLAAEGLYLETYDPKPAGEEM